MDGHDGEDAALKRHRVAKLALRLPQVLAELRAGTIHLTGLFLLSRHLTDDNATTLLHEARRKSRRQIDELIARWLRRSDVPPSLTPIAPEISGAAGTKQLRLGAAPRTDVRALPVTCSKPGEGAVARLEGVLREIRGRRIVHSSANFPDLVAFSRPARRPRICKKTRPICKRAKPSFSRIRG